jgi:hypothetical protein
MTDDDVRRALRAVERNLTDADPAFAHPDAHAGCSCTPLSPVARTSVIETWSAPRMARVARTVTLVRTPLNVVSLNLMRPNSPNASPEARALCRP